MIRYSTSDDVTVRDYSGTLTLSGLLQKVRLSAYAATSQYPVRQSNLAYIDINFGEAAEEPTPDNPSGGETPGTNGSTGGSGNTNEKNNYYVPVTLYNAYKEESSMGWVAFANAENALWVENSNGTYDVQVATNPVNVSGYISAITSISSDDYSITPLEYGNIETSTKFDGTVHNVNYVQCLKFPMYLMAPNISRYNLKCLIRQWKY